MGHGHRAQFAPDEGGAEHCTNLFLMVPFLCLYGVLVAVINLICDDDGMILFEILSLLHSSFGPDHEKTRLTALNAPRPCDNSHFVLIPTLLVLGKFLLNRLKEDS